MNALFGNLSTDGLEEVQDRLGGFQRLDTDAYDGVIKVAYAGQAESGARNVTVVFETDGHEFRETIYVTNKKGENWYVNKNDKKIPLPGFTTINDICLIVAGKELSDMDLEEKVLNVWDKEANKEVPKSVLVLSELTGQQITLGIQKELVDITEKQGNSYVPTGKTREQNTIDKVFHTETRMTVAEAKAGREEPDFYGKWVEANKGKVRDKTDKSGKSGTVGRPGGNAGGPPQAGQQTQRKKLFGN